MYFHSIQMDWDWKVASERYLWVSDDERRWISEGGMAETMEAEEEVSTCICLALKSARRAISAPVS